MCVVGTITNPACKHSMAYIKQRCPKQCFPQGPRYALDITCASCFPTYLLKLVNAHFNEERRRLLASADSYIGVGMLAPIGVGMLTRPSPLMDHHKKLNEMLLEIADNRRRLLDEVRGLQHDLEDLKALNEEDSGEEYM